ncbi:enterochelin esterase [Paenibacillus swuensis]|uniref:Enterochelin esterase n=1 Tax=Paenibacillus swuensis TaxID=1178515 RepID=A0A172TL89_9BACL|nr:alpha/beta hydrolase-fold protein [Paenibacillus swuensis]ANE47801.1 enterochelin esterase [Paenibacillus swuensis]
MTDSKYYKRTIVKETISSTHLQEDRNLRIFLPPGYNEVLSYPVMYCQDGEDFFNFGRVATHMTRLILDEDYEPVIIVGVDVDKSVRTSEYSPDGTRFEPYTRFFAEELIPYIEQKYAARQERSERVLAGDSLGGTVSLHIALNYPELFDKVLSLSGAFYESTLARLTQETDLSRLDMYMVIGLQEESVVTDHGTLDFLSFNRRAHEILVERGAKPLYSEQEGKHVWGFWQGVLPEALQYFYNR